ncbi:hypothetical protein [Variovorax soli]|jgi:hypothetical protein|uniref:hypothetical protein n=1 Tax=Variovorax soli TaxID=376815 RepID=UPI000837F64E|nr:hypothetical protein [Variovorax soli]
MLEIQLDIAGPANSARLFGKVWNVSRLAAFSDYDFGFEGREEPPDAPLKAYPRWSEPVSGLFARCLGHPSVARPTGDLGPWSFLRLQIGIRPGGVRDYRPLVLIRVKARDHDLRIATTEGLAHSVHQVNARIRYRDAWEVAEHALRVSAFGADDLQEAKPLDVPIRSDGQLAFVCMGDIPEPARSVFRERMRGAGCPVIPGLSDLVYAWDWTDFLNGRR